MQVLQCFCLCVALSVPSLAASPAKVLNSGTFQGLVFSDLTAAPDGTLWALGRTDGKIHHISPALELIPGGDLSHPFGPAAPLPPFHPICRGLAYIASQNAFVVLNSSTFQIARMNATTGEQIGSPLLLGAPQDALLTGLAYDAANNYLWCVDSEGDRLFAFDATGGELRHTLPFPGDDPPETLLYGSGVAFGTLDTQAKLYVLYGTIFQQDARTVLFMNPDTGQVDPFSLDLGDAGEGSVQSIALLPQALAVVLRAENSSTVIIVEATPPAILPPSELLCQAQENGDMLLSWRNNGLGPNGAYTSIAVRRNGTTVAQLSGTATSFLDESAPKGLLTYSVRPSVGMEQVEAAWCTVRNRHGSLLSWVPFPGGAVSGIAVDPDTGDVWATDAKPVAAQTYRLWHFTSDLTVVGSVEFTSPGPPYGITFWPDADLGNGPETLILIANEGTNSILRLRKDGTAASGAVPLRLPAESDGPDPKVGPLAFDPTNGQYFLAVLDTALQRIVWVNRYGFPPEEGSAQRRLCRPPGTTGVVPTWGLAFSQESGFLQAGIETGSIYEFDTYCNVTPFTLNPAVPAGPFSSIRVKDFAYNEHVLYVASPATNSLFRLLGYPTGGPFLRGNANSDQKVDVADVIAILAYLFEGSTAPPCLDGADANDDGRVDISDPVYLLFFLFDAGPPPPAPYPQSGLDPTLADDFTC